MGGRGKSWIPLCDERLTHLKGTFDDGTPVETLVWGGNVFIHPTEDTSEELWRAAVDGCAVVVLREDGMPMAPRENVSRADGWVNIMFLAEQLEHEGYLEWLQGRDNWIAEAERLQGERTINGGDTDDDARGRRYD